MNTQTAEGNRASCFPFASSGSGQPALSSIEQVLPQAFLSFAMSMNTFCRTILTLPGVKKIGFKARGENMSAWTFADESTPEMLAKIYAAEMDLMDANPKMLFDFAVKFDSAPEPPGFYIIMGQ